jgi:ribonuclease HII
VARTGRKLLNFDRQLGVRLVAGADEAGRGSLAGPLVAGGVLLDYDVVRGPFAARLSDLNDSKQLDFAARERVFRQILRCATRVVVEVIPSGEIDRSGLHASNLEALGRALRALAPPAEICLSDGFRLGDRAPEHQHVVNGDSRSAAIAAASIVAKVTRDRLMRRFARLYPQFGFGSHVGYITPSHSAAVRACGPTEIHRMSFRALCYSPSDAARGPRELVAVDG